MGVYYSAKTIIGYEVRGFHRFNENIVQNCGHNPPSNAQFCPTCGKKVGTHTERETREHWDIFQDAMEEKLPHGLVYEQDFEYSDAFWIGYGSSSIKPGESGMVKVRPFDEIKTLTLALLEPHIKAGLFTLDENNFGIWTIHLGR